MKKVLLFIFSIIVFIPFVSAKNDPVKVYIFEAGGCPYCEAEIEYLEGLSSYKTEFIIVKKEAYVDHIDWAQGKDYDLTVKVANTFKDAGFEDATYQATPFVVISDLYAASAYNTSLEEIISKAYKNGDKDIVSCIDSGKTNCLSHLSKTDSSTTSIGSQTLVSLLLAAIVVIIYILKSNKDKKEIINEFKSTLKENRKNNK